VTPPDPEAPPVPSTAAASLEPFDAAQPSAAIAKRTNARFIALQILARTTFGENHEAASLIVKKILTDQIVEFTFAKSCCSSAKQNVTRYAPHLRPVATVCSAVNIAI
jgi:hypothetical protein